MNEPRPINATPAMVERAAAATVADMERCGVLLDIDPEQARRDIAKCGRSYMDGYELAKALDDRCYWSCDFELAEALDGFAGHLRDALEAAEKEWAERTNPQPPFPDGTRVQFSGGRERGIIDGIYKHGVAKYTVIVDGDPDTGLPHQSRRILRFEEVSLASDEGRTP